VKNGSKIFTVEIVMQSKKAEPMIFLIYVLFICQSRRPGIAYLLGTVSSLGGTWPKLGNDQGKAQLVEFLHKYR
jgi:hypothetical protein